MTEHQRAVWAVYVDVSSAHNYAMQYFCETIYTASAQHQWPMAMDKENVTMLAAKLVQQSIYSDKVATRNISQE